MQEGKSNVPAGKQAVPNQEIKSGNQIPSKEIRKSIRNPEIEIRKSGNEIQIRNPKILNKFRVGINPNSGYGNPNQQQQQIPVLQFVKNTIFYIK